MAVLYLILGTAWVIIWVKTQEHTTKMHVVIGGVTVAGKCDKLTAFKLSLLYPRTKSGILWI